MKTIVTAGFACLALLAPAAPALALPPVGTDPVIICPRGYVLVDDVCTRIPPPAPVNSPVVAVDLARQNTARSALRVTGSARDADAPAAALTVQVRVDGALVKTLVADQPDPPVATPGVALISPPVGVPGHRFDVTVPAAAGASQVCVTAVNVGSTGANTTLCKSIDRVTGFVANSITYDVAHAVLTASTLESLDRVTNTNNTSVQQSTTISGSKTVTDTQGWSDTQGVKVTVSGGVGIPLIADGKVTVEGSASFTQNGSSSVARVFSWQQPVLVPPHSRVVASVAVTKSTLVVPYSLVGAFVYASGFSTPGSTSGSYSGVNAHDLEVSLTQFDLDGALATKPVSQPKANFLRMR